MARSARHLVAASLAGFALLLALGFLLGPSMQGSRTVTTLSAPRSYEELTILATDQGNYSIEFEFVLNNTVGPWEGYTKAAVIDIVVLLGPELRVNGGARWNSSAYDQWNWTFPMTAQVSAETQANLVNNRDEPVFTTVNVVVNYTDANGALPRTITRSQTVALNYHALANPILLPAAVGMGLGGAGAVGLGIYVVRRARLDELFLMHDSGMLIRHWSRRNGQDHDSDILSGMIIVLQEFVRDTWKTYDDGEADLEELRFGDQRVVMIRGAHSVLAAVVQGRYLNGLPRKLRHAVDEFEQSYGHVLADWNGNLALLPQADAIAARFLKGRTRTA